MKLGSVLLPEFLEMFSGVEVDERILTDAKLIFSNGLIEGIVLCEDNGLIKVVEGKHRINTLLRYSLNDYKHAKQEDKDKFDNCKVNFIVTNSVEEGMKLLMPVKMERKIYPTIED